MPADFKYFKFVIFILFGICFLKFGALAKAQVANLLISCQDTRFPDFHSLRPQPASICQVAVLPSAAFCGNNLTLHETVTKTYVPGDPSCTTSGNKVTCNYTSSVPPHTVTIDLGGANLPFMGNTEDVTNSQNQTDTLTDAQKVNGYVSWYLNGVINRAEYGGIKNTSDNLINYSGPIQKLLPQAILDAQRIQSVLNIYQGTNHNQTVVCAYGNTPVSCYPPAIGSTYYKLSDWIGDLSLWNDVTNAITGFINNLANLFPLIPRNLISQSIGDHWNQRVPPLPWGNDPSDKLFTDITFQKAYNEWGGKTCAIIPVINILICANNIFVPDKWADLYPYIPLSSTEDLKGSITAKAPSGSTTTGDVTVSNVSFNGGNPTSTLFFPHMIESSQLADLLQNTFVASSEKGNKAAAPTDVSSTSCSAVEVRSNPGDSLHATDLVGLISYTASFSCQFTLATNSCSRTGGSCLDPNYCCPGFNCNNQNKCVLATGTGAGGSCSAQGGSCLDPHFCCDGFDCGSQNTCIYNPTSTPTPQAPQSCSKDVYIDLSTEGSIPKADTVWSQLVAGPQAIFKRIFPKTNVAGSVGQIIDIPGSTNITYSAPNISQSNTDLKFPHVGGISEYFLKGIQTMLRPKGYGEPITFAPNTNNTTSGNVDCDQSAPDITLPNTIGKEALHQLAIQWEGGKEGNHILECYNDVARKSLVAGISPAFTFLMWINESGGSNYNISNQDWGINSSQITGLTAQLERFLQLPSAYKNNYPQCFGKTKTNTEVYFDLFAVGLQGGQCVPGAGQPYMDLFKNGWNWFTTCPMANYPFGSSCY